MLAASVKQFPQSENWLNNSEMVLKNVDTYGDSRDGLLQVTSIVLKLQLLCVF